MLRIHKLGVSAGEAFLLEDDKTAFMFDTGFAFSGYDLVEEIRSILGDRPLDAILLTHSHYDHACGSVYIQHAYPNAPIYAHEYAEKVFHKEGARRLIREMDQNKAALCGVNDYECLVDELHVDHILRGWDEIELGDYSFTVIPMPGHTHCSVGYWCDQEKLLLACETIGVPAGGDVVAPTYLVGYRITLDTIDRVSSLPLERMLIAHTGLMEGSENCRKFLQDARYWAVETHRLVHASHDAGEPMEVCTEKLHKLFYTPVTSRIQPEKAFYLNAGYMIPMLLREP